MDIQQYEIRYRYFDIEHKGKGSDEWRTVLFPSRAIANNRLNSNPLHVEIDEADEALQRTRRVRSDNETLLFAKLRVKHGPYFLWSALSPTQRRTDNWLVLADGQTLRLTLRQRKRKRGQHRRQPYAPASAPAISSLSRAKSGVSCSVSPTGKEAKLSATSESDLASARSDLTASA